MTITVPAVYEGDGVLKLERPVDLKEKAKVNVIIEAAPEATLTVEDDDPTGWKTAEQFIGMWKGAPARSSASLSEDHDRVLYSASDLRRHELLRRAARPVRRDHERVRPSSRACGAAGCPICSSPPTTSSARRSRSPATRPATPWP